MNDGPGNSPFGPAPAELVLARRVLLDALEALRPHTRSLILVGAQAVYLTVGEVAGFGAQPTTTDGDLAIDARELADMPQLEALMSSADFELSRDEDGQPVRPGVWDKRVPEQDEPIPIDLIVPRALSPAGRRAARIPPHDRMAAMSTEGLEVALVDHVVRRIEALEPNDARSAEVKVAGPAALVVAKAYKLHERTSDPTRARHVRPKDALDVVRIFQATTPSTMATLLSEAIDDETAGSVAEQGVAYLDRLFSSVNSPGTRLAVEGTRDVVDPDIVRQVCTNFTRALLALVRE